MLSEDQLRDILLRNGFDLLKKDAGQGGSARVHQARARAKGNKLNISSGAHLAVKEYLDDLIKIPGQTERIRTEVRAGALVRHSNVVKIHGLLDFSEKNTPLVLMEWVDGVGLDKWLNDSRKWEDIQKISLGLIEALQIMHDKGVLHRDIKPANIFARRDGSAVLMDMGVVEVTGGSEATLHTSVKDFLGSVRYAAPQYILGEQYDAADDVYSLGATLYFLVTGHEIFENVERKPLLPYHILTSRAELGSLVADIPAQISILIEGALSRDRHRRPTLDECRDLLQNPSEASYVQRELDARNNEKRGFEVISVEDNGATVFADLRGVIPALASKYVVVRLGEPIRVPSLNSEVRKEKWIADVELKHIRGGVGHFSVQGKRWVEGKPSQIARSMELYDFGTPGHWVEFDKLVARVQKGDMVIDFSS